MPMGSPTKAMINGRGNLATDPLRNFRFLVAFYPYDTGMPNLDKIKFGFTSVSGLSVATESIPYREGGMNTTLHQIPGQTTFSPVTLSRGVHLGEAENYKWMRRLFSTTGNKNYTRSSTYYNFRAAVDIMVLGHPVKRETGDSSQDAWWDEIVDTADNQVMMAFRLYNAWITSLAYSDLNAGDNAVLVEQIVLAHEGFEMYWASPDTMSTNVEGRIAADKFSFPKAVGAD